MTAPFRQHPATADTETPARTMSEAYDRALAASGARGRFVDLPSGRRVHVAEAGRGPTVVHLHGTSTSGLSHLPLLARMPQVHSVVLDRPGAGLTEGEPVSAQAYRSDVVAFVDEVLDAVAPAGAGGVTLVGASMGGTWALWYTLARPERVGRLALLGAAPLLPGTRAPVPLRLSVVRAVDRLTRRVVPANRSTVRGFMKLMGEGDTIAGHPDVLDGLLVARRDPRLATAAREEFRAAVALFARGGMRPGMRLTHDELRSIAAATLLVLGDRDPVSTVDAAREVARTMPDARLEVLPAGHVPWLGHPDRVAAMLTSFVLGG